MSSFFSVMFQDPGSPDDLRTCSFGDPISRTSCPGLPGTFRSGAELGGWGHPLQWGQEPILWNMLLLPPHRTAPALFKDHMRVHPLLSPEAATHATGKRKNHTTVKCEQTTCSAGEPRLFVSKDLLLLRGFLSP